MKAATNKVLGGLVFHNSSCKGAAAAAAAEVAYGRRIIELFFSSCAN